MSNKQPSRKSLYQRVFSPMKYRLAGRSNSSANMVALGSKYYTKDWIPEIGCNDVRPRSYWYSHDRRDGESRRWNLRKGIWETVVLLLSFSTCSKYRISLLNYFIVRSININ